MDEVRHSFKSPLTTQKRINVGYYDSLDIFCADIHKIFDNAMAFNIEGSQIHEDAAFLKVSADQFSQVNQRMLMKSNRNSF
jgi:hypothetical protein